MGYDDDYLDNNSYYGVCLNCGSAKCGTYGGCRDNDNITKNKMTHKTTKEVLNEMDDFIKNSGICSESK